MVALADPRLASLDYVAFVWLLSFEDRMLIPVGRALVNLKARSFFRSTWTSLTAYACMSSVVRANSATGHELARCLVSIPYSAPSHEGG